MGGEKRENGTKLNAIRQARGAVAMPQNIQRDTSTHMHTHTHTSLTPHPHPHPHTHTHPNTPTPTQTHMYTHLYNTIHMWKLIQRLHFSIDHFFYSEKLQMDKSVAFELSDQMPSLPPTHESDQGSSTSRSSGSQWAH